MIDQAHPSKADHSELLAVHKLTNRPPALLSWTACVFLVALWGYLRLVVFSQVVFPLTFVLPLLICVWTRRRSMLWIMAAVFTAMIIAKFFFIMPDHTFAPGEQWATLSATLINILVGAVAVHCIILLRGRLELSLKRLAEANEQILAQNAELAQQAEELATQAEELMQQSEELAGKNEELSQQSEEMAQQNEELTQQSEELAEQNEELQTQSEEIQALNNELGRREALLQKLLDAAHLAGSQQSAMQTICDAAREMLDELKPVIVVYEKEGDELIIRASAGLDGRPLPRTRPAFAELVIQQNRTACLEDTSLRPDLSVLMLEGQPPFCSALCSPLCLDDVPIGVVAFYTRHRQEWTEVQFRLIEWLTSQCAHILETLRLQEAIKKSEAMLRAVLDQMPSGVTFRDATSGEVLLSNTRSREILGSLVQVPGDFVHYHGFHADGQPYGSEQWPLFRTIANGEIVKGEEIECELADGRRMTLSISSAPVSDAQGQIFGGVSVFDDVTERKQAERALRRQNERLALLSEAAAHLLGAKDPTAMVRDLFVKVCDHLNVQAYFNFMVNEEGDALYLDSFAGIPERAAHLLNRLEFGQAVCGTVAASRQPIHVENVQHSPDSIVKLIKSYGIRAYCCHPLTAGERLLGTLSFGTRAKDRFDDDEVAFMRAICQYVAMAKERLRLEKELRDYIQELAGANDRLEAANAELAGANQQLAEADKRKDEFLAMLAHELRNPLAPVRNAVAVLGLAGTADSRLKRQREVIERQVTHMARLLDDLLDVSRISRGKIQLKKQNLRLEDVLAQAVETVTPLVESRRHELSVDLSSPDLRVEADADRLAQIVGNLLSNAAKYTEEGGRIWLEARREGGEAVICVRDTGMGIDSEMLPYVFDLFAQAARTVDRSQGGLGIGLTMVKRLVQMHGGTIEARSAGLGQGSEFILRLPALPDEIPEPDLTEVAELLAQPAVTRRILVVDDLTDSAESLAELLRLMNHDVRTAHSGAAALETVREFHPELVLLDIGMPQMDGFEVARRLRAEHGRDHMTLVAMTGYGQERDREQTRQAGFDAHLVKPVNMADLDALLNRIGDLSSPAAKFEMLDSGGD